MPKRKPINPSHESFLGHREAYTPFIELAAAKRRFCVKILPMAFLLNIRLRIRTQHPGVSVPARPLFCRTPARQRFWL